MRRSGDIEWADEKDLFDDRGCTTRCDRRTEEISLRQSGLLHWESLNGWEQVGQSKLGRGPHCGAVAHVCRKVPIGYNGAPNLPSKVPLSMDRSANPTTCLTPGAVRPMVPNHIRIRSAVVPQCTGQTHRPTQGRTDRQIVHRKVWRL